MSLRTTSAVLACAMGLVCALTLRAAEWTPVQKLRTPTGSDALVEYDADSVERAGTSVKLWERITYVPPKQIDGVLTASLVTRVHYDCEARTFYSSALRAYDVTGKVVYSRDTSDQPHQLLIGTPGYVKLRLFCSRY